MSFAEFKEAVDQASVKRFRPSLAKRKREQIETFQELLKKAQAREMLGLVKEYWGVGKIVGSAHHLSWVYEYEGLGYAPEETVTDFKSRIKYRIPANTYHFAERKINVVRIAVYNHGRVNQLPTYRCLNVEHFDVPVTGNINDQLSQSRPTCRNDFRLSLSSGTLVDDLCFNPDDLSPEDLQQELFQRLVRVCAAGEGGMLNPLLRAKKDGEFLAANRASENVGRTFFESRELCYEHILQEALARKERHPILFRLGGFRSIK